MPKGYKGFQQKELNPMWKGNDVGYSALHEWIKNHITPSDVCNQCGEFGATDLANISQEYKRETDDWEWLCRTCHMEKDGRMAALRERNKNRPLGIYPTEETKKKLKENIKYRTRDSSGRFNGWSRARLSEQDKPVLR